MEKYFTTIFKSFCKDLSEDDVKSLVTKLLPAKTLEEVKAVMESFKLKVGDEECTNILNILNSNEGELKDEDLDTVAGGCESEDCNP